MTNGTRVRVTSLPTNQGYPIYMVKYFGQTGTVWGAWDSSFGICFDDPDLQDKNRSEGPWIFTDADVEVLA